MAEKIIVKDIQKLTPGSELVQLFELEYLKDNFAYFTSGIDDDESTSLRMRDFTNNSTVRTYTPIPVKADGFELKNDGAIARPTITLANATSAFSDAIGVDFHEMLGLRMIRRLTLKKYLYGETGDASPPVEFPRSVWIIDRVKSRTKVSVTFELVAPFDIQGVTLPARNVLAERCPFIYQGAGDHLPEWKKAQSGCNWHLEGKIKTGGDGTEYTVYVNQDDEYVIPSSTSFATYSSGAVTINSYYKTTKTTTRFNADGSNSSVSVNDYWQAIKSTSSPGTPSDSNSNFKRIRVYSAYSHGTEYFSFLDDRDNDYVTFTDNVATSSTNGKTLLWKTRSPSDDQAPGHSPFWERGDGCSKTTTGCKKRFGFNPINSGTASSTGKAATNTSVELPFGGFPGARAFS
tara:strand:- start:465 stop:1676 length:1212 start_codon:yes stop_codon:yes gene_type:complete